jgi:hypothetical protein
MKNEDVHNHSLQLPWWGQVCVYVLLLLVNVCCIANFCHLGTLASSFKPHQEVTTKASKLKSWNDTSHGSDVTRKNQMEHAVNFRGTKML